METQQAGDIASELRQLREAIERRAPHHRPGLRIVGIAVRVLAWVILLAMVGGLADEVKKVHRQLVSIEQTIKMK